MFEFNELGVIGHISIGLLKKCVWVVQNVSQYL
jgi:hypothetical protein